MIADFETVKAQLFELARVVNAFKSEAVQLRIVELVLGTPRGSEAADEPITPKTASGRVPRRRRAKVTAAKKPKESQKRSASSGTGAVATLAQLSGTTFFDKPRTINDIVQHCKHKLARNFKANEFSGKLGRMIQNGELTREKNANNQYEYKKP